MPIMRVNGNNLQFELEGNETAPVLVFSNSLGTDMHMWNAQRDYFRHDFRCLFYDTRGHGGSGIGSDPVRLTDLADDIVGIADNLGISQFHLVGLSLGGLAAQQLVLRNPERLLSLTLMATGAYLPTPEMWQSRADLARAEGMAPLVDATMKRWFTEKASTSIGSKIDDMRASFLDTNALGYASCCEAIGAADLRGMIAQIGIPTLILSGSEDSSTPPEMGRLLHSAISSSIFKIIDDAAHMLAIEQSDVCNHEISQFLKVNGG
jgi:3-oxoadipate enol-lactonase/4-carboxymuconolactone decarboxylase